MSEPLNPDAVRIVPLGGLGEIGMNCLALEQPEGIVVIDCGVEFPFSDLGVDVMHPDFSYLLEARDKVCGLFVTHGHEDHIGAIPYLLRELRVPIWGPAHALGLIRRRLREHELDRERIEMTLAEPGHTYQVGPFSIEPVRMSHSIVEASALSVKTAAGTLVHSGDFNLDADPPDGEPTDQARLRELGQQGVRLLLSDSTNVDVEVRPGSERGVGAALGRLIAGSPARVVVVLFSSNVQRLLLLGQIAQKSGRKLCLLGRSLRTHVEVAQDIGRLDWPSDLVVPVEVAADLPRDQVLVLAGGSQAEERSAMRRVSRGAFPALKLEAEDSVVFSSRVIPGNDRPVFAMMGDLLRQGIDVHSRASDPEVHTSGHAGRSEQSRLIEWLRPAAFLPVHGTLHHLRRHAELARELGVAQTLVVENGKSVICDRNSLSVGSSVPHGKVSIAVGGEAFDEEELKKRAELGRSGLAMVSLAIDSTGKLSGFPRVSTRGVPFFDDDPGEYRSLAQEAVRAARRARKQDGDMRQEVQRAVRSRIEAECGCRPVVEVHVLDV